MIVGHFFLAAAVTGLIAYHRGLDQDRALKLALAAGTFALLPDIDVLYSLKELTVLFTTEFYRFTDSFWAASETVHRGLTHSLLTLTLTAATAVAYHRTWSNKLAIAAVTITALTGLYIDGFLSAAVTGIFSAATLYITSKLEDYTTGEVLTALTTGLIIHPFGDVFTGTPPDFFYPLEFQLLQSRIIPFEDPVINFFMVLTLEISIIWFALKVYGLNTSKTVSESLRPLSLVGAGYLVVTGLVNTPTMSTGYQFVFSVILLSFVAAYAVKIRSNEEIDRFILVVNFIMAMTLASLVYLMQYLL